MSGSSRRPQAVSAPGEAALLAACSTLMPTSQDAMNGKTLQMKVVIPNTQGLHMRPAAAFAETVRRFQSKVTVCKDGNAVDGQSPLDLMLLAAEQGTELLVEATGPDAQEVLDALADVVRDFIKEDAPDPPLPQKG